jgi:hypothetical protein
MADSGTMVLGVVLSTLPLEASRRPGLALMVGMLLLAVVLADVLVDVLAVATAPGTEPVEATVVGVLVLAEPVLPVLPVPVVPPPAFLAGT